MTTEERGLLRSIPWPELVPGLMLVRCFRLAISLPVLFVATLGTLAMPIGPWLAATFRAEPAPSTVAFPAESTGQLVQVPIAVPSYAAHDPLAAIPRSVAGLPLKLVDHFLILIRPFVELFDRQAPFRYWLGSLITALWYLVVWSFGGGVITRIAVVRFGIGENLPLRQAVQHAVRNYGWYVASPLFPLVGIACAVVPLFFLGLVMKLGLGVLVAGLLWPIVLLGGLFMAVLAVGLLFGWPLMWPTISAEEASDAFQAFSNSFSFTFQRPLQYLAYAAVAVLIAGVGGIVVDGFASGVIALSQWGVSFGAGASRMNEIVSADLNSERLVGMGSSLMELANQLVLAIAAGFQYGFLFCAASAIYLLLRREVDQTDFDEVYVPEAAAPFTLPTLREGPHGVPEGEETPDAGDGATGDG
jgi:hypothetical protein